MLAPNHESLKGSDLKKLLASRMKYMALADDMRTPVAVFFLVFGFFLFRFFEYWNSTCLWVMVGGAVVMNAADVHFLKKEEDLFYRWPIEKHADLWRVRLLKLISDFFSQAFQLLSLAYIFAYFFKGV
jgi:hypothetical protein